MNIRLQKIVQLACSGVLLGALALVACQPAPAALPTATPTTAVTPAEPVSGSASIETLELLIMESFPVQVNAIVSGNLPDGCTTIGGVTQAREANRFTVTLTTLRDANAACTEALVPYQEIISLDVAGLAAGNYVVDVNGMTQTFTLSVDNVLATPAPQPTVAAGFVLAGSVFHDVCAIAGGEGGAPVVPGDGCVERADGGFAANGTRETGEPGLADLNIVLLAGACPGGEQVAATTSDGDGNFSFVDIPAGSYCAVVPFDSDTNAAILIPGAWTTPNADGAQTIDVNADATLTPFGWDYQFLPVPPAPATPVDNRPTVFEDCIELAAFGGDVTIPDDTLFEPGDTFIKTWRLINAGGCTWGNGYALQFVSGEAMGAPVNVPITTPVGSGEVLTISVPFVAPEALGTYRSDWQLLRPDGQLLGLDEAGDGTLWVQIVVVDPGTLGSISGFMWDDTCDSSLYIFGTPSVPSGCVENDNGTVRADGVYDPISETPLAGVTVVLGTGECGDATEIRTTRTDAAGNYRFGSLVAGTYCVYVEVLRPDNTALLVPGNFTVPQPGRAGTTLTITGGSAFEQINFAWDFAEVASE